MSPVVLSIIDNLTKPGLALLSSGPHWPDTVTDLMEKEVLKNMKLLSYHKQLLRLKTNNLWKGENSCLMFQVEFLKFLHLKVNFPHFYKCSHMDGLVQLESAMCHKRIFDAKV